MHKPPVAKRIPVTSVRSGHEVVDEYAWIRDREDPDTVAYLEAENAYTEAWFTSLTDLQEQLFEEIKSRILETDLSVPARRGPWWYITRTEEGKQYPIFCRRTARDTDEGEQVLIDSNELAEGHEYFELGALDVSQSHRLLAYSTDVTGAEVFTMRIRDLDTGVDLPDLIEGTQYGSAWSLDDRHLFYTRPDDAWRSYQIWRHEVGTDAATDTLVYQEDDSHFDVGLDLTRDGRWVIINIESRTTSEVRLLDAADPLAAPRVVEPREAGVEYSVDVQGDRALVVTNLDAVDFRLVEAPLDAPGRASWTDMLPHRPGVRLFGVDAFADHIVAYEWADALPTLRVIRNDGTQFVIDQPEAAFSLSAGTNLEYEATTYRFNYQSLVTPPSVFDVDLVSGERTLLKQQPVLGGFDAADYETARLWAEATDGTRVPISLVARKGLPRDGSNPAVLYGYGSYESIVAPWFSWPRISLLDRGVVFAVAHVRGGGELGRRWYLDGKLLHKRNTFTDFVACAEHLIDAGWTSAGRLAIRGGSAGGLLVGAAMNLRPDLFASVVAEVPFVDVVNSMLDETLPLTVAEWEEWGNPAEPEFEAYMSSYAPYENIAPVAYPAIFATAGFNDPRVSYHEPAKWVARLRATTTGDNPLLLKTEMVAGHGGKSGRYDAWREEAEVLAFVLRTLGVE
ncbi:MAG TPA: S9 family peptidase [Acidimicrobiales bacterium]|nr:S9 family peptidase [Acidimicrobiales bacterium]